MKIRVFVLRAGLASTLLLAAGWARQPDAVAAKYPSADPMESKADISKKMIAALTSTPCLHITGTETFRDQVFSVQIWMTATKSRGEVRKGQTLVFATCVSNRRVQEFSPSVTFKNGTEANNVLVEYDAESGSGFDEWPRLVDTDFACGPGGTADSWLKDEHPAVPDMLAETLQSEPELQLATINGRNCYWMHVVRQLEGSTLTKDLYVDRKTYEPVRQGNIVAQGDKVIKSDYVDYTIEHRLNDAGIEWRLDPAKLALRQVPIKADAH